MVGTPESPPLVQVNRIRIVAEEGDGLIMVPVHVASQEIENGQVDQVSQSTWVVVRRYFPHGVAVMII